MKRLIFITFLLQVISVSCVNNPDQSKSGINETIRQLVDENGIPGINFSVIYSNGRQENFSAGYADIDNRVKMQPDYVMFSGSIGKTYAVAVLLQLADEDRVDMKAKLKDYFPETDWIRMLPNIDDITIEMLLQHTSGLPRYVMKAGVWDTLQLNPDKVWSYKDRLSFIFNDQAVHRAGEGWSYSDTNYILIGMLIEKITGSYYYDEVQSRILKPSQLAETYPANSRNIPHLPAGYSRLPDMFRMPGEVVVDGVYAFNPQMEWTGGGMASTTADLARWAAIYYNGNIIPEKYRELVITPNSQAQMDESGVAYGMGSFIFNTQTGLAYGHTGFVPGFNSVFAWYPEKGMAVALQVNCDWASEKMSLTGYLDRIFAAQ